MAAEEKTGEKALKIFLGYKVKKKNPGRGIYVQYITR